MGRKSSRKVRAGRGGAKVRSVAPGSCREEETGRSAAPANGRFRGWRGWLLRIALLILSPVLFFVLLEGGLRIAGYGYPTGFFLGPDARGAYTANWRFGWRFFPKALARDPHPCLLAPKPTGAIRIFVLGSSAAMGTPDPSFSFGRILEVMLRECYPDRKFEVVNAAMTAINSHAVLEIARDCAAREPDLFVVYTGNNEVVGPYGPGTVFQEWSPGIGWVRAALRVKSTRTGQLIENSAGSLRSAKDAPVRWDGMRMFMKQKVGEDDPRLAAVYENFGRNLTDLCGVARKVDARVVLSNVAVNLSDCPPFASRHRPGLRDGELAEWEALYGEGCGFETAKAWETALDRFERAAAIDDRFADLQFRIGRCMREVGRSDEALRRFVLARDLDGLRFRADSRTNAEIRKVADREKAAGVRFVDAESAFAGAGRDLGDVSAGRLFHEHVHFTFDGDYLLARAVFDQVCEALPQLADSTGRGAVPSRQRCAELLALTPWDDYQIAADMVEMTSREPFVSQIDHDIRQSAARARRDNLRTLALQPEAREAAWKTYGTALAAAPDDWCLHRRFGRLAKQSNRPEVAVEHLRIAVAKLPGDGPLHNNLGTALAALGKSDEALTHYQKALAINPDDEMAHFNLGNLRTSDGKLEQAIGHFLKAVELNPGYDAAHFNLGNLLAGRGRTDEAIARFRTVIEIRPDDVEAHSNLGALLAGQGRTADAIGHFEKALEIRPGDARLRSNLELARSKAGKP